jgi:glyoxylase-like metal-dependent hydrolase (beta-lactamase superfamily II)
MDDIRKLQDQGRLTTIEGLFITHYHDDHTDKISQFLERSDCPVYVTPIMEDVTRHPGAYRLPAMTANAIAPLNVVPDGHKKRWKEFTLTFYDFPGQTVYHDALLVEKDDGETIFFVGDSFTPSGIDDYCLQNRNLLHQGKGFLYCLDLLRETIPSRALLINQHVLEPFRFEPYQIDHMALTLSRRRAILSELFPWGQPNYGIDEQWARFYPYGQEARPGAWAPLSLAVLNHSNTPTTFSVTLNAPDGCTIEPERGSLTLDPGQEGRARFRVRLPDDPSRCVYAITADVAFGPWDLRRWCECLVKVAP